VAAFNCLGTQRVGIQVAERVLITSYFAHFAAHLSIGPTLLLLLQTVIIYFSALAKILHKQDEHGDRTGVVLGARQDKYAGAIMKNGDATLQKFSLRYCCRSCLPQLLPPIVRTP